MEYDVWDEYDSAAKWCARRWDHIPYDPTDSGLPLPPLLSVEAARLIEEAPEAFSERVREAAYMLAMRAHTEVRSHEQY